VGSGPSDTARLLPKGQTVDGRGVPLMAYSSWGAVAAHTGGLLRLQGRAAAAHVLRWVKEDYAESGTASRAGGRVPRSFIRWGVLDATRDTDPYGQGKQYSIEDPGHIAPMVVASLRARSDGSAAIQDLLGCLRSCPFRWAHTSAEHVASLSSRLDIPQHGLDDDITMLREEAHAARHGDDIRAG